MAMVFCRGCGKELHETAPVCPHCGYVQKLDSNSLPNKSVWMSTASSVLAILCFVNWFNLPDWNKDMSVGLWMFALVALSLASISVMQKRAGNIFSIISIVIAAITILILIGRL